MDAACSLSHDGAHHETNTAAAVDLSKSRTFKLNQGIVEFLLHTCKWSIYSKRSPDTEVFDISPSSAVDHGMEGMKVFNPSDHLNTFIAGDFCFIQEVIDLFEFRIMLDDIPAPGCTQYIGNFRLSGILPSFLLISDDPQKVIDVDIGLGHGVEGVLVEDHIRTQEVQKGIEVIIAVLKGCRCQENDGIRISAEDFHAPVCPGIGIADIMGFINDDQVKMRDRIQV